MGRRVPLGWKRPRGRPRTTWSDQLKDSGKPVSTLLTRAQESGQIAVEEGRDGLAGLRDLVVHGIHGSTGYALVEELPESNRMGLAFRRRSKSK